MNTTTQQTLICMSRPCTQCRQDSIDFDTAYRRMLRKDRVKTLLAGLCVLGAMALSIVLPLAWIALSTK